MFICLPFSYDVVFHYSILISMYVLYNYFCIIILYTSISVSTKFSIILQIFAIFIEIIYKATILN